ncbi:trypsin-like peptidase domain-containing protein [Candidatus Uhrbacteria bacterium]|nr:trypsin-like peptidase domain-containing protein [Candidatus Uhrbacteria bacterium]
MPRFFLLFLGFILITGYELRVATAANAAIDPRLQAVVWVQCANRQGSGTVIHGDKGYVLTDAHVVIDIKTKKEPAHCTVGFIDVTTGVPTFFYQAAIKQYVFLESKSKDFAILQIGISLGPRGLPKPFPFLKSNEFTVPGESITVHGFSQGGAKLVSRSGTIEKFQNGFIQTDAEISPGDSGGAALDQHFRIIGIPNRIVTLTSDLDRSVTVAYELEDIRMVMTWMDTYGVNAHDEFFVHEDYQRYHQNAVFITSSELDCQYVARNPIETTVYCLMNGGDRMVFPNDATFLSWFPDFSGVDLVSADTIAEYPLNRNVTHTPGTLIKSATSAQVYVVVDSFGTLRWIPTEEKAKQLWGPGWAGFVKDIPDEFWTNYTVGQPLDH